MLNEDHADYYKYTGPQRLEKAVHTLEGLLLGVAIDGNVSGKELLALKGWMKEHMEFAHRHPFNEIIPMLTEALEDGVLDEEEQQDLLWLCNKLTAENGFFSAASSDMQRLHGVLGGIAADGVITKEELEGLEQWMGEHEHLRTCWPYDELDSMITSVLADGRIDEDEHSQLWSFFSEFASFPGHRALDLVGDEDDPKTVGVCAMCPEIVFPDKLFCFTGSSKRSSRKEMAVHVEKCGGKHTKGLVAGVDYLIIGGDGNPCWAFSCYGRKVEAAIKHRRNGRSMLLVHEYDFWDAIEEAGV